MMLLRDRVGVEADKAKQMSRVGRPATVGGADKKKVKVKGYKKSVSRVVVWYVSYRCQRTVSAARYDARGFGRREVMGREAPRSWRKMRCVE